jgi:hypothetical protein
MILNTWEARNKMELDGLVGVQGEVGPKRRNWFNWNARSDRNWSTRFSREILEHKEKLD